MKLCTRRTFSFVLPCRGTTRQFLCEVSPNLVIFQKQKFVTRTFLFLVDNVFVRFYIHVEYIPNIHDPEMMLVRHDQQVPSISSTWEPYSASFQPFSCHLRISTRIILVFDEHTDIPSPSFNRTSSNCLSHICPASGCPYNFPFKKKKKPGPECLTKFWATCVVEDVTTYLGHSDFKTLSNLGASSTCIWVYADTSSAACPPRSGSLSMTSVTFTAVVCDTDEPCSVKTP